MSQKAVIENGFPMLTKTLHKITFDYMTRASGIAHAANEVFQSASVVDFGGCLAELSAEVTASAAEPNLRNIKV